MDRFLVGWPALVAALPLRKARQLAVVLRAGAFAGAIKSSGRKNSRPTLGKESILSGLKAIIFGFFRNRNFYDYLL